MPSYTKTATQAKSSTFLGGTTAWTDPGNANSEDGTKSYVEGALLTSHALIVYDFEFVIPANEQVVGIEWRIRRDKDGAGWQDNAVGITLDADSGPTGGANHANDPNVWADSPEDIVYGGPTYINVAGGTGDLTNDVQTAGFGIYLQVRDDAGEMFPARANVDVIEVTVYTTPIEETGTGSVDDPYGEEGEFAYIPFSALVRHFMGIDDAPTGAKTAVGDLFLAQFVSTNPNRNVNSGHSGLELGIGAHFVSPVGTNPTDPNEFVVKNSSWKLIGKMSKLRIPLTGYTIGDIAWGPIGEASGIAGPVITRKYTGFRIFNTRDANGFLFPNCVIDSEDNILCFASLNPWDTRIYARETLEADAGGVDWGYPNNSLTARTLSMIERFNAVVFLYAWGLAPDGAPVLTYAAAKNTGPGTGDSTDDWLSLNPGWTLYLADANPSGCEALEYDAVLNANRLLFPKATSQSIYVLYQGWPISATPDFTFSDKEYANQTFKYNANFSSTNYTSAIQATPFS